jgi:D-alanine-D-alanine ligase
MEVCIQAGAPASDYSFLVKEQCEQFVSYTALERGVLRDAVEALALGAYQVLQCRDAGRVDIRLDDGGRPCFMEINPLPGLHPTHSDLPMIATQAGMSYPALIAAIVASAAARIPRRPAAGRPS